MNRAVLKILIKDYLSSCSVWDKVALWNEYCENANRPDDTIMSMDDFIDMYSENQLAEVMGVITKMFNFLHMWAWMDGYGRWHSSDNISDTPYWENELVDYIIDNDDPLNDGDIEDILKKYKEEEEEE